LTGLATTGSPGAQRGQPSDLTPLGSPTARSWSVPARQEPVGEFEGASEVLALADEVGMTRALDDNSETLINVLTAASMDRVVGAFQRLRSGE